MVTNRLTAVLPLSYTFTGNARDASVTLASNTELTLVPMAMNGSTASFVASNSSQAARNSRLTTTTCRKPTSVRTWSRSLKSK